MKDENGYWYISKLNIVSVILLIIFASSVIYVTILSQNSMFNQINDLIDKTKYHPIDRIDTTPIESLKDGSTASGSFILGSGSISGEDVYIYYTKNPDGGYVRNHISADKTVIYMDENDHPYLISHYVETDEKHVQFINSYSLHVPNNTVQKVFSV